MDGWNVNGDQNDPWVNFIFKCVQKAMHLVHKCIKAFNKILMVFKIVC